MSALQSGRPSPVAIAVPTRLSKKEAASRALESVALLDISPSGKICFATEKARTLLTKYFPDQPSHSVPTALLHWLNLQAATGKVLPLSESVNHGGQLVIRLTGCADGNFQLQLEEAGDTTASADQLICLGLTRREAEVLFWIARGKTSAEIATILHCKTATVTKHIERIFVKLGVETRTAAAAIALEKMGS